MYEFEIADTKEANKKSKPTIQNLAEFLGWDRDKAVKVKVTDAEIAPNGTRRERRINNNFVPEDSCGLEYIVKINSELSKSDH